MYVRLFPPSNINKWLSSSIDCIPIGALYPWNASESDNDYSVFVINYNNKDAKTDFIVLRALADNFKRVKNGVDLFIISDSFLKTCEIRVENDDESKLYCIHANIKNLNFANYKKIIEYTFFHTKDVISYSKEDITNILKNLSSEKFQEFLNYYIDKNPDENERSIKKKLSNNFFKGRNEIYKPSFLN